MSTGDGEKKEIRDAKGRFLPGCSGNPNGAPGTWQPYRLRLNKWLDMSAEEFNKIANSPSEIKKLSMIDVVCVRHVANMVKGEDVRQERGQALDRIEGKVTDKTEITGKDGEGIKVTNTTELAHEHKNAMAFILQRMIDEKNKEKQK